MPLDMDVYAFLDYSTLCQYKQLRSLFVSLFERGQQTMKCFNVEKKSNQPKTIEYGNDQRGTRVTKLYAHVTNSLLVKGMSIFLMVPKRPPKKK